MPDVGEVRYKARVDTSGLDGQISEVEEELRRKGQSVGDALGDGISAGVEKSTTGIGDSISDSVKKGGDKATSAGKGIGTKLGALVNSEFASQAADLSSTLAGIGQDLIKTGLEYNMTLESYQMNFTTMLGSAAEAQDLVNQLSEMARETPFNTNELADAAQMLLTVGYSSEEVMPMLQMLGDVSLGNTEKMSRMALAMSQISSAGKLNAEDLNQLIDAGFNPLLELSEMTGKSMSELKDDMAAGAITTDMVTAAFEHATSEGGKFFEAVNNQGETTNGKIQNLQETFAGLMGKITEGLLPALKKLVGWLADVVGWLSEHETIAAMLGAALVTLTAAFTGLSVVLAIAAPLMLAFGAGFTAVIGPVAAVIAIIAALAAGIAAVVVNFDEIKAFFVSWGEDVAANFSKWWEDTKQSFSEAWETLKQGFSELWESIKTGISDFWTNTKQGFFDWTSSVKETVSEWANNVSETVGSWASTAKEKISTWWSNTKQGFSDWAGNVKSTVSTWASNVQNSVSSFASGAYSLFSNWWGNVKNGFSNLLGSVQSVFSNLWGAAKNAASNLISAFSGIDWGSVGSNIIGGIVNGVTSGISNLVSAARNAAMSAFNAAKNALGIRSPSKKFAWIGEMSGEGFEEGFTQSMQSASKGAENIMADTVDSVAAAGDTAMNLSKTINFSGRFGNETKIEVPLYIDGREVARASAWYMGEQLSWEER